jgi:hypothetical protein
MTPIKDAPQRQTDQAKLAAAHQRDFIDARQQAVRTVRCTQCGAAGDGSYCIGSENIKQVSHFCRVKKWQSRYE